jgi:hypothetical protein
VALQAPVPLDQVVAPVVGGEGVHPDRAREPEHALLSRPDPLAADLDDLAAPERLVEGAAAHASARLDDERTGPGGHQLAGRGQARQAGAHHDHVCLAVLHLSQGGP